MLAACAHQGTLAHLATLPQELVQQVKTIHTIALVAMNQFYRIPIP